MWSKSLEKQRIIDLWSSRKSSGMDQSKEAWDVRSTKWLAQITDDEDSRQRSARRVMTTAEYLRQKGLLKSDQSVIDIGCGPGRFVCEFANTAGYVTGVDISPNMCKFGEIFAQELELKNVSFHALDFKDIDVEEMGWKKKFDLVFSSITPAMSSYESMRKAESICKGFCFQSNYVKIEDPLADEIYIRVLENEQMPLERSFQNSLALYNLLCLEDKYPEMRFYKEESIRKCPVDSELVHSIMKEARNIEMTESLEKKVQDILSQKADSDGCVERTIRYTYSWILWNVNGNYIFE